MISRILSSRHVNPTTPIVYPAIYIADGVGNIVIKTPPIIRTVALNKDIKDRSSRIVIATPLFLF
jgi:anaerobic C4-dicarboxylate transporter